MKKLILLRPDLASMFLFVIPLFIYIISLIIGMIWHLVFFIFLSFTVIVIQVIYVFIWRIYVGNIMYKLLPVHVKKRPIIHLVFILSSFLFSGFNNISITNSNLSSTFFNTCSVLFYNNSFASKLYSMQLHRKKNINSLS